MLSAVGVMIWDENRNFGSEQKNQYESALFRSGITTCYPDRFETGPDFVPGLPHAVCSLLQVP